MQSNQKDNIVQIIHRQQKPINFRPHTHHRLLTTADDLFIFRHTSYQHYSDLLQQWKHQIFESFTRIPFQELMSIFDSIKRERYSENNVSIIQMETDLSDPDREFLLTKLSNKLESALASDESLLFCPVEVLSSMTIELFLKLVASSLAMHGKINRLFSKKLSTNYYTHLQEVDPIEFIQQVLLLYESFITSNMDNSSNVFIVSKPILIISLPFYDNIITRSFINILVSMFNQRQWSTVFLLGQHSSYPVSLTSNMTILLSTSIYSINLSTAKQIFDKIVVEIFIKGKLPVHFSSQVFQLLYDEFQDFTACNSTFLQRILMLLQYHFEHRKSILCMTSEWEWLVSMHLVKGLSYFLQQQQQQQSSNLLSKDIMEPAEKEEGIASLIQSTAALNHQTVDHFMNDNQTVTDSSISSHSLLPKKTQEDYLLKSLSELLLTLSSDDLPSPSIFALQKKKYKPFEVEAEVRIIKQQFDLFGEIRLLWKVMFQFFKICRDALLPISQRERYPIPWIWKEMTSHNHPTYPDPTTNFLQFKHDILQQLSKVSFQRIGEFMLQDLKEFIDLQIWKSFQIYDYQVFHGDFRDNLLCLVETYELITEEIFQVCSILATFSFERIRELYQQALRQQSSQIYSSSSSNHSNQQQPHSDSSSISVGDFLLLEETVGNQVKISHYHILEEYLAEITDWFNYTVEIFYGLLRLSPDWNGILVIDSSSEIITNSQEEHTLSFHQQFGFLSQDFMRQQFMHSLLQEAPSHPLEGPLAQYYSQRVRIAQSVETAVNWFSGYQQRNSTNSGQSSSEKRPKKGQKRKAGGNSTGNDGPEKDEGTGKEKAEEEVEESLEQQRRIKIARLPVSDRCELINTLYDFEKTGLIALKKVEQRQVTILKSIYTGIK